MSGSLESVSTSGEMNGHLVAVRLPNRAPDLGSHWRLWVPSPRAMNAPSKGSPSIVPETLTRPRVPKTFAESGIWTHVQLSPSRPARVWP